MSKRKQARGPEWFTEKIHKTKVDADRKVAETTEAAQRLDERRKAQIRLQIDSINRLLDDPSASDELVRVTENAAANRFLVDALLDRLNAVHTGSISADRFFVMIDEAVEMRNRMVVGDEPVPPPANEHPAHALAREIGYAPDNESEGDERDLDLSGERQDALNAQGYGWGNKKNKRSKRHYYSRPGSGAPSLCGVAEAPDRVRILDGDHKPDHGPQGDCRTCADLVGSPRLADA